MWRLWQILVNSQKESVEFCFHPPQILSWRPIMELCRCRKYLWSVCLLCLKVSSQCQPWTGKFQVKHKGHLNARLPIEPQDFHGKPITLLSSTLRKNSEILEVGSLSIITVAKNMLMQSSSSLQVMSILSETHQITPTFWQEMIIWRPRWQTQLHSSVKNPLQIITCILYQLL